MKDGGVVKGGAIRCRGGEEGVFFVREAWWGLGGVQSADARGCSHGEETRRIRRRGGKMYLGKLGKKKLEYERNRLNSEGGEGQSGGKRRKIHQGV